MEQAKVIHPSTIKAQMNRVILFDFSTLGSTEKNSTFKAGFHQVFMEKRIHTKLDFRCIEETKNLIGIKV